MLYIEADIISKATKIEIDTMIIKDLMECCDTFVDNIAKKLHIDT